MRTLKRSPPRGPPAGGTLTSPLQQRVHEILQIPSRPGDRVGRAFDAFIITLITLNVAAVIVETLPGVTEAYGAWLAAFEWFSLAIFGGELALRAWSATADPRYAHPVRGRARWLATPFAIIDVLAVLPALLAFVDLRFLRVVRLLRLLKLGRYSESVQVLVDTVRGRRQALLASLFLVGMALILFSSFMYYAEREAQPEKFSSIPAAMWWGIVTLTTTGYGDVVPITPVGRLIGGLALIVGIGVLALPVGILASGFVEEIERRRGARACPHCGKALGPTVAHPAPPTAKDEAHRELIPRP